MKNLASKLVLAVAFLTISTIAFAQTGSDFNDTEPTITKIALKAALENADLVKAMYNQLDPAFLKNVQNIYAVEVSLDNTLYIIWGTKSQWEAFFKVQVIYPGGL